MNKLYRRLEKTRIRWTLVGYDAIIYAFSCLLFLVFYTPMGKSTELTMAQAVLGWLILFLFRLSFRIYRTIWRYGGVQSYVRLIGADGAACLTFHVITLPLPDHLSAIVTFSIFATSLLLALTARMLYRYIYKCGTHSTRLGSAMCRLLYALSLGSVTAKEQNQANRIKVAIVGAGSSGTSLAEDMSFNSNSPYLPRCFIDADPDKTGRMIYSLPVYAEEEVNDELLRLLEVQEIVFALPSGQTPTVSRLYAKYSALGYKIKTYDYPEMANAESGRRVLREFDIEDLLFRKPVTIENPETAAYYADKVVLITGGGGSIGSELCRQLARMKPRRIILVDIYENGAYDVQQELKIIYGNALDLRIHIVSVTNRRGLERVFRRYHPQIVINAAAHKHVPLMETDCIEAVENNVFGTLNTVELSEKYKVGRFIQVSTDKAVNPTNVMGATKRMCEFIVQAHGVSGTATTFSATRFGNVLGSAGSVIPLFKRQIANGGPVTVTDKRIIRYFMTIPEASQLVLQSGAMAKNGELFVLDMGKPVKIYDLAESMIRLSGLRPGEDIQIQETGLRPGEKLYEELLIQSEHLDCTENKLIFIERDTPIAADELQEKLELLRAAIETDSDEEVRQALLQTVPTFIPRNGMPVERETEFLHREAAEEMQANPDLLDTMRNRRVLIVDDLSINRDIAADTLKELGMQVATAESGPKAIEAILHDQYDFILMDVVMPYMNGYETAKAIHAIRENVPIVAMTASAQPEEEEHARRSGMQAYIPKPIHLDELLQVLNDVTAERSGAADSGSLYQ